MIRVNGMIQENRVHKFQIRDHQMAKSHTQPNHTGSMHLS